jgi:Right handed beta helix region
MFRSAARSLTLAALVAGAALPAPAAAQVACDQVASEDGQSVRDMLGKLSEGQTGCLRGTVSENVWVEQSGITLTSEPGQQGTLDGQIVIDPDADHVTVRDLVLDSDGLKKPSPIVLGDDAAFLNNDVTNRSSPSICFILGALGHDSNATAERTLIEGNKIHHCGTSDNHRHGIYVEHAKDTRIVGNEIYDNADRAIQLYPDAQDTLVAGNVIDGNGEGVIFSGGDETASSGNVVRNNVISNPRLRAGIESWFPDGGPRGRENVAERNCVFGREEMVDTSAGGYVARDNVQADPMYVDRENHDFRLRPGSPCAEILEAGRTELRSAEPLATSGGPAVAAARPAAGKAAPVKIAIARGRRPGTIALRVSLAKGQTRAYARLEVRRGGRWRLVAIPRLSPGRTYVRTMKASAGALTARAVLLRPGRPSVATFRR